MMQSFPKMQTYHGALFLGLMLGGLVNVGWITDEFKVEGNSDPRHFLTSTNAFMDGQQSGNEVVEQDDEKKGKLLSAPKDTLPENFGVDFKVPAGLAKLSSTTAKSISNEKVVLGRKLFFDPGLSADGTVSCATCHRPDQGFASNQKIAVGIKGKLGTRNSPSLFNRAFGKKFFWDGRADSLEEQALIPISSEHELANDLDAVLKYLKSNQEYVALFKKAFGASGDSAVSKKNLAQALTAFQLVLFKGDSPVDRFQSGGGGFELNKLEKQGLWVYESRGMCWRCHSGPNYSDEKFHNTGVSFGSRDRDTGRFEATDDEQDRFKFKTPTLRGVALTAPYMHDGSIATLEEVVEFYDQGGSPKDQRLSDKLKPLQLSEQEKKALVAFLKALSR